MFKLKFLTRVLLVLLFFSSFIMTSCDKNILGTAAVYEKGGEYTNYDKVADKIKDSDIILFGELHNNAFAHWAELELTKLMYKEIGNKLMIGMEMFEADDQMLIDEYFNDLYPTNNFEDEAKIWKNYSTDYKPILEFCKKNKIEFVATNVPRRYAAFVSRNGLEKLSTLSPEALKYIAPLPVEFDSTLKGYKEMKGMPVHNKDIKYLAEAQAVKDATMAHFIAKRIKSGMKFLHFHGSYHSNDYQGIYWYLKKQNPNFKITTIATIEGPKIDSLGTENANIADFILLIRDDFTKTY